MSRINAQLIPVSEEEITPPLLFKTQTCALSYKSRNVKSSWEERDNSYFERNDKIITLGTVNS